MLLQISFDIPDLEKAISIARQVHEFADILEVGTPLIYAHGTHAIKRFTEEFPKKQILADSKIVDRGKESAELLRNTDCHWITVMAGTSKSVIHATASSARASTTKVMLDLIDSPEYGQSALEAKNLGVDAILLHESYDGDQTLTFLDRWDMIRGNTELPIFIAARVSRLNFDDIMRLNPDGIIIGKAIIESQNPRQEAEFFYNAIKRLPVTTL